MIEIGYRTIRSEASRRRSSLSLSLSPSLFLAFSPPVVPTRKRRSEIPFTCKMAAVVCPPTSPVSLSRRVAVPLAFVLSSLPFNDDDDDDVARGSRRRRLGVPTV
jgi:hypothetical protein